MPGRRLFRRASRAGSTTGCATSSANGCSRSSSRPTRKRSGMSCDEISADWAAQRIKGLDLAVAILNALKRSLTPRRGGGAAGKAVVKTLIESFQYPRKGPDMMWEAAARHIRARGGEILMGRNMQRLAFDAGSNVWRIEVATADGQVETYTARHVISSAPVQEQAEKLAPRPISELDGS